MTRPITVAVPTEEIRERLGTLPEGVDLIVWDVEDPPIERHIDLLVLRYFLDPTLLAALDGMSVDVLQSQSLGYDRVGDNLPDGVTFCNAVGVHEASTAELALGLILGARRGLAVLRDAQREGRWAHEQYPGLAGANVLLVGVGGVGKQIEQRLAPFDVSIVRVARTARIEGDHRVHAIGELAELVPTADIIVLALPLSAETTGLVSGDLLASMKPGSLIVNVSRGAVIDTDALVERLRRGDIQAALDVVDPEPLPAGHPLWTTPGVIITPHVGGHTGAMPGHVDRLVRRQIGLLLEGLPPENIVYGPAR